MTRRWHVVVLALLAVFALACEGSGNAQPKPTRTSAKPATGYPASMVALGDSITAGLGSCAVYVACTRNSWSTGNNSAIASHYDRILDKNPKIKGEADNLAEPGAEADALAGQARRAVDLKPQYVTILIGANDACARRVEDMTSVATFRDEIGAGLARLKKGLPKSRVLMVSIPDLYRLWQVGRESDEAVAVWSRGGICPSMLAEPASTAAADQQRRERVRDRIEAYNTELRKACRAYGGRCRWDGGAAHRIRFDLDLVSEFDYFHPNADGQKELAEVVYPGRFTW
ncbi:lipoprotein [Actinoplanes lobatus]|uniref:Lipoprotein n=1 Tax=Actinoplanes lobatus TaxID=113568 RepID=A0A7W7MGE6_9ACTN|nr:GDSL-type esterase/lipase family protein [Actinoplanes lobatus]MBB4749206.1 lysophospholipase L1-like esterase [Actinoplanes lobatus]GGN80329.1 lipoprotein [Actinoplanes lobatus]GIE45234.1 lipoprotein [Actinoplanes lobatus]